MSISYGYCECGCGEKTKPAPRTTTRKGWIKGEPMRFIRHHEHRKRHTRTEVGRDYKTSCWILDIKPNSKGYAMIRVDGQKVCAHRFFYEREFGPIPQDMELDHLCRVRCCVRPSHLEPVDHAENTRRGLLAKLQREQVMAIRATATRSKAHYRELAAEYGVSPSTIEKIVYGNRWSGISDNEGERQ